MSVRCNMFDATKEIRSSHLRQCSQEINDLSRKLEKAKSKAKANDLLMELRHHIRRLKHLSQKIY